MSELLFSIEYLENAANSLVYKLNRKNIFPPLLNDPKDIISKRLGSYKIPKRSPNSFLIFRKNVQKEVMRNGLNVNMRIVSKVSSILWRDATATEKYEYSKLADIIKEYYEKVNNQKSDDAFNHHYSFHITELPKIEKEKFNYEENAFYSEFISSLPQNYYFYNDLNQFFYF